MVVEAGSLITIKKMVKLLNHQPITTNGGQQFGLPSQMMPSAGQPTHLSNTLPLIYGKPKIAMKYIIYPRFQEELYHLHSSIHGPFLQPAMSVNHLIPPKSSKHLLKRYLNP